MSEIKKTSEPEKKELGKPLIMIMEPVEKSLSPIVVHALKIPIKPRDAFIMYHNDWIFFLNNKETLQSEDEIIYQLFLDGKIIEKTTLNLTQISKDLEEWQSKAKQKFKNEKELLLACHDFMFENLKAISRNESNELKQVEKFGVEEATTLINTYNFFISFTNLQWHNISYYYYFGKSGKSIIPILASHLHRFLGYINEVLNGGLKNKAKLGIFKIGVCPYCHKNKPECGKVFVGKKYDQQACEEHTRKWQVMKRDRKKSTSFLKK